MALQWSITVTAAVTLSDVGHPSLVTVCRVDTLDFAAPRAEGWRAAAEKAEILRPAEKGAGSQDDKVWGLGFGVELRAKG